MLGGFNTNVKYGGRTFHVQTEDSGHANPKIVTLLYEGGVILTSKKSSYEDKVSADNLESVVRELMEAQHRDMVQALKDGALDDVVDIGEGKGGDAERATGAPQVFGEGIIGDQRLDELVIAHLARAS